MDLFNKHYEKLILVVCLVLMILGLLKVSDIVGKANSKKNEDLRGNVNKIDTHRGDVVADFNAKEFESKEAWIQRIKKGETAEVISVAKIMENPKLGENLEAETAKKWDRRYFSVLTRHSRKPIEETEAKYRLEKNRKELGALKENLRACQEKIKAHIASEGEKDDDTRLAELRLQEEGYQKLQADIEMDIRELEARVRYISKFCTEQGSMVDPHEVVCCVNPSCGALILSRDEKCPFCGTQMPEINPAEDDGKDSDGDGLPDDFEKAHAQKRGFVTAANQNNQMREGMGAGENMMGGKAEGKENVLDPYNPSDAYADFDGDSFTNLEEYRFGTDIDDERSFPDPVNFVRVVEFSQDKFPAKLMGINYGKAPREQKDAKWRARFSFMRMIRGREVWDKNEDNWEQVRVGKKFETPDGKVYILAELDEEEVDGKKVATAKVTEYVAPVRPKRVKPGEAAEPQPEQKAPAVFNMRQDEECFFETLYAQTVYFASRSLNAIDMMMNVRGRYYVRADGKNTQITTKFKLEENSDFELVVPIAKKTEKVEDKNARRNARRRRNMDEMGGMGEMGGMDDRGMMGEGGGFASKEYELRTFKYKVAKFNRDAKTMTVKSVEEGKESKTFEVPIFDEEETYQLPDHKDYQLFYQGGMGGNMEGGDMMMRDEMMQGGPGRGPGAGMPKGGLRR